MTATNDLIHTCIPISSIATDHAVVITLENIKDFQELTYATRRYVITKTSLDRVIQIHQYCAVVNGIVYFHYNRIDKNNNVILD